MTVHRNLTNADLFPTVSFVSANLHDGYKDEEIEDPWYDDPEEEEDIDYDDFDDEDDFDVEEDDNEEDHSFDYK